MVTEWAICKKQAAKQSNYEYLPLTLFQDPYSIFYKLLFMFKTFWFI